MMADETKCGAVHARENWTCVKAAKHSPGWHATEGDHQMWWNDADPIVDVATLRAAAQFVAGLFRDDGDATTEENEALGWAADGLVAWAERAKLKQGAK